MATDFLLLQHYPTPDHARFRHYGWHRSAVTFGYAQKFAAIREQLGNDPEVDLCRRPTGGGLVNHDDDWTYALVIPARHALGDARAGVSYQAVHRVLAETLVMQGCPAVLQPVVDRKVIKQIEPAICFAQAESADVVRADSRVKIAGAAQKRSKRGLLFQGSIVRAATGEIDWDLFASGFITGLASLLQTSAMPVTWPEYWDEAVDALAENYATPEWIERR